MVANTPKRHQKYVMPKFECRPRALRLSMAVAPVKMAARPNIIWIATIAIKIGFVDGMGMPKSIVIQPHSASLAGGPAQSQRPNTTAASMPRSCAPIKAATPAGAMPAKVSERERAIVTAGLANDVDAVNQ